MKSYQLICLNVFIMILLYSCNGEREIFDLKCNYKTEPLGIDTNKPEFSWKLTTDRNSMFQFAYRVKVHNQEGKKYWDSQKVISNNNAHVLYDGKSLQSGQTYVWKVKVWDRKGRSLPWSDISRFTTGLLSAEDWKAEWIGMAEEPSDSASYLRKEFVAAESTSKAHVFISGLGYYELYINGQKAGNNVLDPAQTDYRKRVFYNTYDVSDLVNNGNNAIGIILGNGWYNQQVAWGGRSYGASKVIMQMILEYKDGTEEIIVTDATWKVNTGPLVYNSIYRGEIYDARLELKGWGRPGYDERDWDNARLMKSPGGKLHAQSIPPIREIERINPVNIINMGDSMLVYDLGQNITGYTEISISGQEEGTMIRQRFAETIRSDGTIDVASTGVMATGSEQTDVYYCNGKDVEKYKPRFTYHGFRYVEVSAEPELPEDIYLEGIIVHTDADRAGHFECSDTLLNRIYNTAVWTLRGNMHGLLTDCPHRERCGWLGDAHIAAEALIYNMQTADFWIKYIRDIETSLDRGLPTNVAPGLRIKWVGRADWGAAVVLLPWYVYQYYGDLSIAREQYHNMKRYIKYLEEISEDGIVTNGFGDWYDPPAGGPEAISVPNPKYTSTGITTTSLYYASLNAMVRFSELFNYKADIQYFTKLRTRTKDSFNKHFFSTDSAYGSQTANVVALRYNLVEEENREFVINALIKDIMAHDYHFTTGMQGAKHLYNILSDNGYGDIAYKIITNKTFPGIPYLFSLGATTNWENWSTTPNQRGVPRSKSHPMNSGYATWFFQSITGIKPHPDYPGFSKFILQPVFLTELEWAKADYESVYGKISSSWKREEVRIRWNISIPPNSEAKIILKEGVQVLNGLNGDTEGTDDSNCFMLGSGNYELILSQ